MECPLRASPALTGAVRGYACTRDAITSRHKYTTAISERRTLFIIVGDM